MNEKEIAFLEKLASTGNGGNWLVRNSNVRPEVQSLIARGYCRTAPERIVPLGIHTGRITIFITEAGRFSLEANQQSK